MTAQNQVKFTSLMVMPETTLPDLKQFMVDLMCSGDGDIPLSLRVGNGNETDSAMFAQLVTEFLQQWQIKAFHQSHH